MNDLNRLIISARKTKGLSIRSLAKSAGLSHSEMNKIEDGRRANPSALHLKKIADVLGIDQLVMMTAAGYIDRTKDCNPVKLNGTEQLSEQQLQTVQAFIDFIKTYGGNEKNDILKNTGERN